MKLWISFASAFSCSCVILYFTFLAQFVNACVYVYTFLWHLFLILYQSRQKQHVVSSIWSLLLSCHLYLLYLKNPSFGYARFLYLFPNVWHFSFQFKKIFHLLLCQSSSIIIFFTDLTFHFLRRWRWWLEPDLVFSWKLWSQN